MFPAKALAERVALVFGNGDYNHASILPNPDNDAQGVGAAFRNLGFQVDVVLDATHADMRRALRKFERRANGADVAIIYFAGHGLEIDNNNFLLPVDAQLERDVDVAFEAIPLESLMVAVEGARELSLVILDACRENPFTAQMQQSTATRSIGRGLAVVEPSKNTLLAYAARAGTVAYDGDGQNSPYAQALISALEVPGLEIGLLFRTIRDKVVSQTQGQQEPFLYGSLSAQPIFLHPASLTLQSPPQPQIDADVERFAGTNPSEAPSSEVEVLFWTSIKESRNVADFQAYLDAFPQGVFAGLARIRISSLDDTRQPTSERSSVREASAFADPSSALPFEVGIVASVPDARIQSPKPVSPNRPVRLSDVAVPSQVAPNRIARAQTDIRVGAAPSSEQTSSALEGLAAAATPAPASFVEGDGAQVAALTTDDTAQPTLDDLAPAIDLLRRLTRAEVRELQERLSAMTYNPGPADGVYGPRTERAIRAFEEDQGLSATGSATYGLLVRARAAVSDGEVAAWKAKQRSAAAPSTPRRAQPSTQTTRPTTSRAQKSTTVSRSTPTKPAATQRTKPNLCYTAANRACYNMPRPLQHCTKVFSLCGGR